MRMTLCAPLAFAREERQLRERPLRLEAEFLDRLSAVLDMLTGGLEVFAARAE